MLDFVMKLLTGTLALCAFLVLAAMYIIWIVADWKVFTKAGEKGWKSIIPIYNGYVLYRLTWNPNMYLIGAILFPAVGSVATMMFGADSFLGAFLSNGLSIASLIISIVAADKLAKSFGKGTAFAVGLVFLQPIFMLILGFGPAKYLGNTTVPIVDNVDTDNMKEV